MSIFEQYQVDFQREDLAEVQNEINGMMTKNWCNGCIAGAVLAMSGYIIGLGIETVVRILIRRKEIEKIRKKEEFRK